MSQGCGHCLFSSQTTGIVACLFRASSLNSDRDLNGRDQFGLPIMFGFPLPSNKAPVGP